MSDPPESSVVKILYEDGGEVAGAGVLVGKKWVLTCKHVVEEVSPSVKIGDQIYLTFFLHESEESIESNVVLLANEREPDIAILELKNKAPPYASIGKLAITDNFWDQKLRICGFSSGMGGEWVSAVGRGRAYPNYVQIDVSNDTGYKIEEGFSGTPVFDTRLNHIVGILVYKEKAAGVLSGGFTPVDSILNVCREHSVDPKIFEVIYNPSLLKIETHAIQEATHILLPSESPFNTHGTVPLESKSYIKRDSDKQLEEFLNRDSLICLQGHFRFGKSSLLIRIPRMLSKDWIIFRPRIDLYKNNNLEESFFFELRSVNKEINDWMSMGEFLKRAKLALLIDEISTCSDQDVSKFIEKLYALNNYYSNHVCVVLTTPIPISAYIEKIGLDNPRYYDCWHTVELTYFSEEELIKMLEIFPHPVAFSLRENITKIQELTLMKPNAVQDFCDKLWKHLSVNGIPVLDIDHNIQSYLKKINKA